MTDFEEEDNEMTKWIVYTDGSALDNSNLDKRLVYGGWAWAIAPKTGEPTSYYSESYKGADTTNNKMELRAILDFLTKAQKPGQYVIRTDSAYCITSMQMRQQRLASRMDDQLFLPSGKPALNSDLLIGIYEQMARLEEAGATITFEKVKGHSGDKTNEFVDRLAQNRAVMNKLSK